MSKVPASILQSEWFYFFIFIILFIYLVVLGHGCSAGFNLVMVSKDSSRVVVHGLLIVAASLVADHKL